MANRYPLIIDTEDGNKIKELPADDNLYLRNNSITDVQDINALGIINAADIRIAGRRLVAQTFTDLTDTPNNYTSAATKFVRVNSAGTALEFATLSSLGSTTVNNLTVDSGDIFPLVNLTNKVGKSDKQFAEMHAGSFYGTLKGLDGTIVFDAATNRIPYAAIYGAPTSLSEFTNDIGVGGSGDSLVNGSSSFSMSSDGTLTLTHPAEPALHPLSTVLTVQKAAGNYHTISGAYGLSLQATPVPGGFGLNTNTNFVDIFHDGISVNVNNNTWAFGTDGELTFPNGGQIANYPGGVGASNNSWFVTPGSDGNGGVSSQDGQQYIQINNNLHVEIGTSYGTENESIWRFGLDGKLTLPNGSTIGDGDAVFGVPITTARGSILIGNLAECAGGESHFHIMKAGQQAIDLFLGDDNNYVKLPNTGGVEISSSEIGAQHYWTFGTDGSLTLPQGSYIDETAAPLGTAKSLDLHPGNPVYPTQYLRIYPTNGGDADHLHLTSGDLTATELFLGDDEQYVKLTNTGNVEIRTGAFDYYNDTKGVWTFDSDGVLTLPTHNATLGSRIKSAVDITIETGRYYLVDLVTVGGGSGGGIGVVDFQISSAPDWATAVAVGDHVVSGTWTQIITAISDLGEGRWRVEFASEDFSGATNTYSFYKPGAAGGTWNFGANGALRYPRNAVQQPTDTVECLGNTSTVVYTASSQYQNTIKLLIQVEGYVGAPGSWDTQSCEIMVAKSWRADDIASTVYGIVHTSVAPLATFTAEWNALTNRVQVMCATPSANSVYVRTFATEITTAD